MDKVIIYGVLTAAVDENAGRRTSVLDSKYLEKVASFTISEIILTYFNDYNMLPYESLDKFKEYLFPMLFNLFYNQALYPTNYKKLLVEEALIMSTVTFSENLVTPITKFIKSDEKPIQEKERPLAPSYYRK